MATTRKSSPDVFLAAREFLFHQITSPLREVSLAGIGPVQLGFGLL